MEIHEDPRGLRGLISRCKEDGTSPPRSSEAKTARQISHRKYHGGDTFTAPVNARETESHETVFNRGRISQTRAARAGAD